MYEKQFGLLKITLGAISNTYSYMYVLESSASSSTFYSVLSDIPKIQTIILCSD